MAVSIIPIMWHSSCYCMRHSWLTKIGVSCLNQLIVEDKKSLSCGILSGPFQTCAAHCRSLLQQPAADAARAAVRTRRVFWYHALTESSMSSTTGQSRNRRHKSHERKKLRCREHKRTRHVHKRHGHHPPRRRPTLAIVYTTASNKFIGWNLY